jgi:RimJ/RimL family protein N-acetyltransferase
LPLYTLSGWLQTAGTTSDCTYAFSTGLHRISLRVLASNNRAISSYRKCGFLEEGVSGSHALVDGIWEDDMIMEVLDREFGQS